jgi:hypothetical protein
MKPSIWPRCGLAAILCAGFAGDAFAAKHELPPGCADARGEPRASLRIVNKTSHPVYVRINYDDQGAVAANSSRSFQWILDIGPNTIYYGKHRGTNRSIRLRVNNRGPRTCRDVRILTYADETAGGKSERINRPTLQGAAVDWCVSWATNCGKGGADQYCRSRGYASAADWSVLRPGRTWVIGSNRHCVGQHCQGFAHVTCRR